MTAARAFLTGLIDDAGLFPPARLPMAAALAAHAQARASAARWILGRFIVPASRLREMLGALEDAPEPIAASVVLDGPDPAADVAAAAELGRGMERFAIEAFEVPPARAGAAAERRRIAAVFAACDRAGVASTAIYTEVVNDDAASRDAVLEALRDARSQGRPACAKIRCGGIVAEAMPSDAQVAAFLWAANAAGVPFKATAGLHHPVRHFNATAGFAMHGFLNVIGAAVLAHAHGLERATLQQIVAEEDPGRFTLDEGAFTWNGIAADAGAIEAARATFVHSYGSCSFDEPLADLRALKMLSPAAARA